MAYYVATFADGTRQSGINRTHGFTLLAVVKQISLRLARFVCESCGDIGMRHFLTMHCALRSCCVLCSNVVFEVVLLIRALRAKSCQHVACAHRFCGFVFRVLVFSRGCEQAAVSYCERNRRPAHH